MSTVPALAQGPEGGIIIEGNFGSDPATFNPILCTETSCQRIVDMILPKTLGVDPRTATFAAAGSSEYVRNALVTDWTISEDGTVYTLKFREDWNWSDGTPITAKDYKYTWDAIISGEVDTNLVYVQDVIADMALVDDYTLDITLHEADCNGMLYIGFINPLPSHLFEGQPFSAINEAEWNTNPDVAAGPFSFGQMRAAEFVSLLANEDYPDAALGYVNPEGFIYKNVPDATVMIEQFLAGELNVVDSPSVERRAELRAVEEETGEIVTYSYPGDRWDYLTWNMANPANPQDGMDADGNVVPQEPHPIFGDIRVRQALAWAVDVEAVIQGAVFGEGTPMAAGTVPASWAYDNELEPIGFDQAKAAAMLEEAGWVDIDDDGVLEAQGAAYAEDGTEFEFTLYTNEGNTRRAAVATVIQDELSQIGVVVDYQVIDWNTMLDILYAQTYDAIILGWRNGYPDDPDLTQLFSLDSDVVGAGDNTGSYYNPELIDLMREARRVPNCDIAVRTNIYKEVQRILQNDMPYLWLYAMDGMYTARAEVQGFDPMPAQMFWNVDNWSLVP